MNTLESDRGSTEAVEYGKLHLESVRKQNELLDLEIEMKKIALERNKVALQIEKRPLSETVKRGPN